MITSADIEAATGERLDSDFQADGLDLASGKGYERILTFLDDADYVQDAVNNHRVVAVLTTDVIAADLKERRNLAVLPVADPRWTYFSLQNHLTAARPPYPPSDVDPTAIVHPSAVIPDRGVTIGPRAHIEANVTLFPGVEIREDVVIRAGAVVGTIGFEHKRTTHGTLSVLHDGGVTIGARTEIGAQSTIAQGFLRRNTIIGCDVRIDCLSHIAHGDHVGDRVFIAAGVTISGSVTVENDAWIGPGAVIRDQLTIGAGSRVGIGSVVLRDVLAGAKVLGNPARAHA